MKLEQLKEQTGNGTELVSLILPQDYHIREAKKLLAQERSEAKNIKSKSTRKSVEAALKKAQYKLKELGEIPENGVAIYASKEDCWHVEPENELNEKLYRCDNKFQTEPVERLQGFQSRYAIVVADRNRYMIGEATPALETKTLHTGESNIPGKHKKGGQSAQRYERFREKRKEDYVNEIADRVKTEFLDELRRGDVLGLIVSGQLNRELKNELHTELKNSIVAESRMSQGVLQAVQDVEENLERKEELVQVDRCETFLDFLAVENGKAEYGPEKVREAAEMDAVETLLVPEGQYV